MLASGRFNIAQIALRGDPFEKTGLARFVSELVRFECLLRLRDKLLVAKIEMMFRGVNFFQRVTQQTERFGTGALE